MDLERETAELKEWLKNDKKRKLESQNTKVPNLILWKRFKPFHQNDEYSRETHPTLVKLDTSTDKPAPIYTQYFQLVDEIALLNKILEEVKYKHSVREAAAAVSKHAAHVRQLQNSIQLQCERKESHELMMNLLQYLYTL